MGSWFKSGLLLVVCLVWLVPGIQAYRILEGLYGLDAVPDAPTLLAALNAIKWCLAAMAVATAVVMIQWLNGRQSVAGRAQDLATIQAAQRRMEAEVEQLSDVLRQNTASLQTDFGNFTTVGTRLRSALETRLSSIESLLQRPEAGVVEASDMTAAAFADVGDRLRTLEKATELALVDLRAAVTQNLRGLHAELQARDARTLTDFGQLETRLSDDSEQWAVRLKGLEHGFAELTRKTALDNAQLTANIKLLSMRLKEMAAAVQQ
jgi:hypothetical protein